MAHCLGGFVLALAMAELLAGELKGRGFEEKDGKKGTYYRQ